MRRKNTLRLRQIAACFVFADGTFTPEDLYDACKEYRPAAFGVCKVPDIYQSPGKTAPLILSFNLTAEETSVDKTNAACDRQKFQYN